jgi:phosphate transport system permease protein
MVLDAVRSRIGGPETQPSGKPITPRNFHPKDIVVVVGAAGGSFGLVWLIFSQLLPLQGIQGFLILWAVAFVVMYYVATREMDGTIVARDRVMAAIITVVAIGITIPLILILGYVTAKGIRFIRVAFFTTTMENVGPLSPSSETGGLQAIVGTIEQVGIAMVIAVPLGVMTAVYLNEVRGRLRRPVRIFVDAMSGTPSIVAGLFIFAMFVTGHGFSGFAAALALSVLMLPTVTRATEVVLRLVPDGLREASLALGSPEWRTTWKVVLPTARSGVITAILLGIARVVGETAPLIMTSFGNNSLNVNPFSGPQASMPLSAFKLFQSSQTADVDRAWVFAFVLIAMVLVLFVAARRSAQRQLVRR